MSFWVSMCMLCKSMNSHSNSTAAIIFIQVVAVKGSWIFFPKTVAAKLGALRTHNIIPTLHNTMIQGIHVWPPIFMISCKDLPTPTNRRYNIYTKISLYKSEESDKLSRCSALSVLWSVCFLKHWLPIISDEMKLQNQFVQSCRGLHLCHQCDWVFDKSIV